MAAAPYEMRRRYAEGEAFRRRREVEKKVDAVRSELHCDKAEGVLVLVGPSSKPPGNNGGLTTTPSPSASTQTRKGGA